MDIKTILNNAQKNKKKVPLSATISIDLKKKLEDIARKNKITISTLVEAILEEILKNEE